MAQGEIHKNDVGTLFKLTISDQNGSVQDLSSASVKQIKFKKPSGTVATKTASFYTDGSDGIIVYQTVGGDLDEAGQWEHQGFVTFNTGSFHTDKTEFIVHRNLN